MKRVLVTGGCGFIGSALCLHLVRDLKWSVVNVDKLTYAGRLANVAEIANDPLYSFHQLDICDQPALEALMIAQAVDGIIHLAAETHVDRSITGPADFIQTNVVGTQHLLEAARSYYDTLAAEKKASFRFHHVSTDEVFGDLPFDDSKFNEDSPYNPSSPYSASKAASDMLVRAWHHTYDLPIVISNCSNNYGPRQFPEKLIPLMILNAIGGKPLPVYGNGRNVRDWLHVDDHARALAMIFERGKNGKSYLVGGDAEHSNIEVVKTICTLLDQKQPKKDGTSYHNQITFVEDRPGHDRRYAIDCGKTKDELGWKIYNGFREGLGRTTEWYISRL